MLDHLSTIYLCISMEFEGMSHTHTLSPAIGMKKGECINQNTYMFKRNYYMQHTSFIVNVMSFF